MVAQAAARPEAFARGAIRSRTLSRLSGATPRQLQYWHQTGLLEASVIPGERGVPRYYSWVDYMKARAAVKLLGQGLPNSRLRAYIEWLDKHYGNWYEMPLLAHEGRVVIDPQRSPAHTADESRQAVSIPIIRSVLTAITDEGPLGLMSEYADAVAMDPLVKAASPVIRGTRIETYHVAELTSRGTPIEAIAEMYGLPEERVARAVEFETTDAIE